MPKFAFDISGTIEAENERDARDMLNNLPGLEDVDILTIDEDVVEEED